MTWRLTVQLGVAAVLVLTGCKFLDEEGSIAHGEAVIHAAVATLEAAPGSEASGSVKFTENTGVSGPKIRDQKTSVDIRLMADGLTSDGPFTAAVHVGTCAAPGEPFGADGAGLLGPLKLKGTSGELRKTVTNLTVHPETDGSALGKLAVVRDGAGQVVACGMISTQ